jgi:GNAT superfamily N-acetyltransferase
LPRCFNMTLIRTTYLEMLERDQLRPKKSNDSRFLIAEAKVKQWAFNRFLYVLVGEAWTWHDKLSWSDEKWKAYAESDAVRTFVACYDGSPAGYFELSLQQEEVELVYFGLAPRFIGKGLGGVLLTYALEEAWKLEPKRVWVHTCSLDHPAAVENYLSRGMTIFKIEEKEAESAASDSGPSQILDDGCRIDR